MTGATPPDPPPAEDLQFKSAEYESGSPRCVFCKNPITGVYYRYAGEMACENCGRQRGEMLRPAGAGVFGRSVLFGIGAAIAGCIIFALVGLTGYSFSLISILVGWMVGKAMRKGSGGRGGRKYQLVAVLLTYGAITTSYIPEFLRAEWNRQETEKKKDSEQVKAAPEPVSAGQAAVAFAILILFSMAAPILIIMDSPGGGLLNALIIFFGLWQAWKLTQGDPYDVNGPFQLGESP